MKSIISVIIPNGTAHFREFGIYESAFVNCYVARMKITPYIQIDFQTIMCCKQHSNTTGFPSEIS